MKTVLKSKTLPGLITILGVAALLLRAGMYLLGTDEKGLLIAAHPMNLLVWAVTAAAALLILVSVWKLDGSQRYTDNFEASSPAALGSFVLAAGIALFVLTGWSMYPRLIILRNLLGLLAVPALILAGLHRWQGKRPFFLLYAVVCVFLTLYAISSYQSWSSRPQPQDYVFDMAGGILLALFAYYQTAFCIGMGKRRMQLGTGLLAVFFCIAALAGGRDMLLYLCGGVWALTNLCNLIPVPRRRKNPLTEGAKDDGHEAA